MNKIINKIRQDKQQQELISIMKDKKTLIEKEITEKVKKYKSSKGKNTSISEISLKRILLEASMLQMEPEDKLISYQLLSEYREQESGLDISHGQAREGETVISI